MPFTLTGAVSGAAVTGLTTPGYTLSLDNALSIRERQAIVTALSGTQSGVVVHSINNPFTVTVRRPGTIRSRATAVLNVVSGKYSKIPFNEYLVLVRKGAAISDSQNVINEFRGSIKVYAGSETEDLNNVSAMISLGIGFLQANAQAISDASKTGNI